MSTGNLNIHDNRILSRHLFPVVAAFEEPKRQPWRRDLMCGYELTISSTNMNDMCEAKAFVGS